MNLVRITIAEHLWFDLEFLRQIYDQTQWIYSIFINGVHRIEYEIRAQEQSQQKDFGVVIHVLVEGSDPLAVDDQYSKFLPVEFTLDGLAPYPEALGARIDGGSDSEALRLLVEDDSVQEKGFACAVLASHRDHTDLFLDTSQEFFGFFTHEVFPCRKSRLDRHKDWYQVTYSIVRRNKSNWEL